MEVKELVAAVYAAVPNLPPEKAELMRSIASWLDVTFVVLTEVMDQNTAQTAALAGLNEVSDCD